MEHLFEQTETAYTESFSTEENPFIAKPSTAGLIPRRLVVTENCAGSDIRELTVVYHEPSTPRKEVLRYFIQNLTSGVLAYAG